MTKTHLQSKKTSQASDLSPSVSAMLREHGLKSTRPRETLLNFLFEHHGPFSCDDIHSKLKESCDLVTVYRNLMSLEEAGLVRRCEFGDGIARFELCDPSGHHHHHLVCKKCGTVETLDDCDVENVVTKFAKKKGFVNVSHTLEFFGVCPSCQ